MEEYVIPCVHVLERRGDVPKAVGGDNGQPAALLRAKAGHEDILQVEEGQEEELLVEAAGGAQCHGVSGATQGGRVVPAAEHVRGAGPLVGELLSPRFL